MAIRYSHAENETMTDQTTLAEAFDAAREHNARTRQIVTDGGQEETDDHTDAEHFDPDAETVTDAWEGAFIYSSWGYGQTNVELAQIVEVSDSGKTVLARLVAAERVEAHKTSESLRPSAEQYGDEFRLHVRNSGGDPAFRGSYPFLNGEMDEGTRRGSFLPWSSTAGATVHQTATGYGH